MSGARSRTGALLGKTASLWRSGSVSRERRAAVAGLALVLLAGCDPTFGRRLRPHPPVQKITAVEARVPRDGELPPLVGRMQRHRVAPRETLLDVARGAGLGFRELRDANPQVDEWVPPRDAEIVVPSRFILPRTHYRGLVINIPEMRLYFFPSTVPNAGARVPLLTWPIGIGTEQAPSPVGSFTVRSKDASPTWIVPDSILKTMEKPQRVVPPGPENPLGAYRIRLSKGLYSIHGTNSPWSIGRLTTHGCIRLYPEDIEALFPIVKRGTPGELVYQPVKFGEEGGRVYAEVHDDVYVKYRNLERYAEALARKIGVAGKVDPALLRTAVREKRGFPVDVTRRPTSTLRASDPAAPRPAGALKSRRGRSPS